MRLVDEGPLRAGGEALIQLDTAGVGTLNPTLRVELRLVEQRKQRLRSLDGNSAKAVVVAQASVGSNDGVVALDVPTGLAPSYDGTILAWTYELALCDDERKRIAALDVDVIGGPITTAPAGRTKALVELSNLAKEPGVDARNDAKGGLLLSLGATAFVIFGVLMSSSSGDRAFLYVGFGFAGGLGLLALYLFSAALSPGRKLKGAVLDVDREVARPGDLVTASIDSSAIDEIELGLVCVELVYQMTMRGNGTGTHSEARRHVAWEIFEPWRGEPIQLRVPVDATPSFATANTALVWLVRVRSTQTDRGAGGHRITVQQIEVGGQAR